MLDHQNGWRRNEIVFESNGVMNKDGDILLFLDLNIGIIEGMLDWQTYSEPLSRDVYVPQSSYHHPACFRAIEPGEGKTLARNSRTS